jgi:hypothetical protein
MRLSKQVCMLHNVPCKNAPGALREAVAAAAAAVNVAVCHVVCRQNKRTLAMLLSTFYSSIASDYRWCFIVT